MIWGDSGVVPDHLRRVRVCADAGPFTLKAENSIFNIDGRAIMG